MAAQSELPIPQECTGNPAPELETVRLSNKLDLIAGVVPGFYGSNFRTRTAGNRYYEITRSEDEEFTFSSRDYLSDPKAELPIRYSELDVKIGNGTSTISIDEYEFGAPRQNKQETIEDKTRIADKILDGFLTDILHRENYTNSNDVPDNAFSTPEDASERLREGLVRFIYGSVEEVAELDELFADGNTGQVYYPDNPEMRDGSQNPDFAFIKLDNKILVIAGERNKVIGNRELRMTYNMGTVGVFYKDRQVNILPDGTLGTINEYNSVEAIRLGVILVREAVQYAKSNIVSPDINIKIKE